MHILLPPVFAEGEFVILTNNVYFCFACLREKEKSLFVVKSLLV